MMCCVNYKWFMQYLLDFSTWILRHPSHEFSNLAPLRPHITKFRTDHKSSWHIIRNYNGLLNVQYTNKIVYNKEALERSPIVKYVSSVKKNVAIYWV